ncbi:uncharacterized protein LOC128990427 [Macrosteles quadrilineatus]|uniref:uncharacterized protein LOC128990427 n=1 Tax=Macrosteles quadrilineatus TaxID=74068 RepID=UPI0023E0AB2D|nr:uncharacterized protein LOC128990427 [Macrosteles quadrilineatus]
MIPKLAFCFLFTVIAAKPSLDSSENPKHNKAIQSLEALDKVLKVFVDHSTSIQELAAAKSMELKQSLETFPEECSFKHSTDIEINERLLLAKYYNCSVSTLLKDFASLGIDSATYVYGIYKDTTDIAADILACTSAGFNPFTFIVCIVRAARVIPSDISDIIYQTENYSSILRDLLPQIEHGIKACFHKTSSFHSKYIEDVVERVRVCSGENI